MNRTVRRLFACQLGLAAACGSSAKPAAKLPRPFTHEESLAHLDPKEGCDFLPRVINPDPVALVAAYIQRDNRGEFLGATPWLDSAYECPGHLPGPDEFTVVRTTRILNSLLSDTVTKVLVASAVLGVMSRDSVGPIFLPQPRQRIDTFVVNNTPYGWRIELPQLPDNVLGSWVLAHPDRIKLRQSVRDALVRALDLPHNER